MAHDSSKDTRPDLTCREVVKWTSAYLDENLNDPSQFHMALHLGACAGCATYLKQMVSIRHLLGLLPMPVEEPAQRDQLRQAFSAWRNRMQSSP